MCLSATAGSSAPWCIQAVEYYSAMKINRRVGLLVTWVNCKSTELRGKSQAQKILPNSMYMTFQKKATL